MGGVVVGPLFRVILVQSLAEFGVAEFHFQDLVLHLGVFNLIYEFIELPLVVINLALKVALLPPDKRQLLLLDPQQILLSLQLLLGQEDLLPQLGDLQLVLTISLGANLAPLLLDLLLVVGDEGSEHLSDPGGDLALKGLNQHGLHLLLGRADPGVAGQEEAVAGELVLEGCEVGEGVEGHFLVVVDFLLVLGQLALLEGQKILTTARTTLTSSKNCASSSSPSDSLSW